MTTAISPQTCERRPSSAKTQAARMSLPTIRNGRTHPS